MAGAERIGCPTERQVEIPSTSVTTDCTTRVHRPCRRRIKNTEQPARDDRHRGGVLVLQPPQSSNGDSAHDLERERRRSHQAFRPARRPPPSEEVEDSQSGRWRGGDAAVASSGARCFPSEARSHGQAATNQAFCYHMGGFTGYCAIYRYKSPSIGVQPRDPPTPPHIARRPSTQ